jgi:hypothetical protein
VWRASTSWLLEQEATIAQLRIIQRRYDPSAGGRLPSEWWSASIVTTIPTTVTTPTPKVVGFRRNRWSASIGISGRLRLESVVGLRRNTHIWPSHKTPNSSRLDINSMYPTWADGVHALITRYLSEKSIPFPFLHRPGVYDVFLWILIWPVAFWLAYRISPFISYHLTPFSSFLSSAAYFYLALLTAITFRALFMYARWVYPLVHYRRDHDPLDRHRAIVSIVAGGLIVALVYDIIRLVFLI